MAVIAAFSAIVSGFEAYTQHLRGAFRHWLMWTPVGLAVPVVVASIAALFNERAARQVLPVVSVASLVDGAVGFVFHLRGIQKLPGGFRLGQYNLVIGPPIFAPLLMGVVGVLGLLASVLRPEVRRQSTANSEEETAIARGWGRQSEILQSLRSLEGEIARGQFQQSMALVSASLAILAGGEAYFEHLRGSFNQRLMWTPIWVTPPMIAAAVGAARSERIARKVLPVAAAITFLDGLLGFGLHLRGLQRMPGGLANLSFNVIAGPPLFAPLLFTAVGLLAFLASLLRPRVSP